MCEHTIPISWAAQAWKKHVTIHEMSWTRRQYQQNFTCMYRIIPPNLVQIKYTQVNILTEASPSQNFLTHLAIPQLFSLFKPKISSHTVGYIEWETVADYVIIPVKCLALPTYLAGTITLCVWQFKPINQSLQSSLPVGQQLWYQKQEPGKARENLFVTALTGSRDLFRWACMQTQCFTVVSPTTHHARCPLGDTNKNSHHWHQSHISAVSLNNQHEALSV